MSRNSWNYGGKVTGLHLTPRAACFTANSLAGYGSLLTAMRAGGADPDSLEDAVDLSNVYYAMSILHRRNQDLEQADSIWGQRTALWSEWDRKLPRNAFVQQQLAVKSSR